ncbi:TRAP transporter small permease [Mesorhizobium sp. LHD-90]|uniref:TRAP transporter small permease n=1 Tax=Mesorhizobium sp. LHD-90 TaxID=3071414 RepID=UPI0027DEF559|nr:TRAP transporter small permease [Mesorhizobium sp. LHD-90]MDQ6434892.1 TRAP transporter small permease [Mesorhizobium sp. LHD-90]
MAGPPDGPRLGLADRLAAGLAVIGGILICLAACLVTVSVVGRWLFNSPVTADYEMVEIGVGVAVFAFLGYTQARSGHIAVDTFTSRLPARLNAVIDGVWDLVLAGFLGFFAWGLYSGGMEARQYGATLVQLPWPVWPVYLVCAVLAGLACLIAVATALIKIGGRR